MSNYYEYEDVKRAMVHRLFKLGWKVYGYSADNSDFMTDYYDPEWWSGIATKNGYILVVNDRFGQKEDRFNKVRKSVSADVDVESKIRKLERVTVEHGATEHEAETARVKIETLRAKMFGGEGEVVTMELISPKHMANPGRCSWHVEKDGVIIEKGTGLLKFHRVLDITDERDLEAWQKFNTMGRDEWIADEVEREKRMFWAEDEESLRKSAAYDYESMAKKVKTLEEFNKLMNRIDTAAGGIVGNGGYRYDKVKEVEWKKVNKAVSGKGEIREGQCFMVRGSFNHNVRKGSVYRIHTNGTMWYAYQLNRKLTKECKGMANPANYWSLYNRDRFMKWINDGALEWVDVVETKEAVEVEKIKKVAV